MKYLKTFFIMTILLGIGNLHNEELSDKEQQITDFQDLPQSTVQSITPQEETAVENAAQQEPTVEEKSKLDQWNEHLELLTIEGEYWNKESNIPTDSWKSQAFDLAEQVIKKDKSLVETVKTAFLDAINAKTTLEKGKFTADTVSLINEFNNAIDAQLLPPQSEPETPHEEEKTTIPIPVTTVPEETKAEPAPSTEMSSTSATTSNTAPTPETTAKDVKNEWQDQLKKIKAEGTTFAEIDAFINKAYELANQLLSAGSYKQQDLQADFYDALESRSLKKNLYPLNINDTINFFNRAIGIFVPEEQFSYYQQNTQTRIPSPQEIATHNELQKLREEFAQKDVLAKKEQEEQKQKEMQIQAALALAREREQTTKQSQESEVQRLQVRMQQEITKAKAEMEAASKKREKDMREALAKNIEQMAAAQKTAAEKGMLSTITETVSDWWYGTTGKKSTELSPEEQEKLLDFMVQKIKNPQLAHAAKEKLKGFQSILLNFNAPQFWDQQREIPNMNWIKNVQNIVNDLVNYQIMPLQEISAIIKNVLQSSEKILPSNIKKIITEIERPIKEEEQKLANELHQQEVVKQQIAQQKKDKKDQIILAQQKIKDEENRKEEEKKQLAAAATSYKNEKKQWYELLTHVAQNKQATPHENHGHTQEALKKSQSLLHLAHNIPTKNKTALSQKLKQKFSVALLEQQKGNADLINIHHNMDVFNKEVNKMTD